MARKRIAISSSGGISAGSPFILNEALFVSQASPPFVTTQRLGRLVDAFQSIVAPGSLGGLHTFVMGEDAEDSSRSARSLVIGYALRQNDPAGALNQADDQVLLGNSIQLPVLSRNCQGIVAIGAGQVFTAFLGVADSFGESVVIGHTAGLVCLNAGGGDASNAVVIGAGARGHGGSVCIGPNAIDSGLTAVCIGQGSKGGNQSVAIGLNADATVDRAISIGDRARNGNADTIAIGWFADCAGSDSSIALGRQTNTNGKDDAIALGRGATSPANGTFVIGAAGHVVTAWLPGTNDVTDLGIVTTNRFKDFHLSGQIKQVGLNGAAAGVVVLTNAPTSNVVQYIPFTFNGAAGWLPWIPA